MRVLALALIFVAGSAWAQTKDLRAPTITHVRVTEAPQGEPLVVRARIDDESDVFAPAVYFRAEGEGEFVSLPMKKVSNGYEAIIPGQQVSGSLEYFIEAFDVEGNGPAHEGSPEAPIRVSTYRPGKKPPPVILTPPPPPPPPSDAALVAAPPPPAGEEEDGVTSQWWFWTLIAVGAAAAVVTPVVILTRPGPVQDEVLVEVVGPNPTAGL